jgi:hypothetical protein
MGVKLGLQYYRNNTEQEKGNEKDMWGKAGQDMEAMNKAA